MSSSGCWRLHLNLGLDGHEPGISAPFAWRRSRRAQNHDPPLFIIAEGRRSLRQRTPCGAATCPSQASRPKDRWATCGWRDISARFCLREAKASPVAKVGRGRVGTDRVYLTVPICNGGWRLGWISRSFDLRIGATFRCQRVDRVADRERIGTLLDPLTERPDRPATSGRQHLSAGRIRHRDRGRGRYRRMVQRSPCQAPADRAQAHANSSDPPRSNLWKRRRVGF